MEKSARWHEVSLLPEHGRHLSALSSDTNSPEGTCSEALSCNGKNTLKIPLPKSGYVYESRYPSKTPVGNLLAPPRTHSFNPAMATMRLKSSYLLSEIMGATRFDGPAGQFNDGEIVQDRQRSTGAYMQSDSLSLMEERRNSIVSGLDQNTRGDLVGRKLSVPDRLPHSRNSNSKRPTKSRASQISYTLRTVAPNPSKATDDQFGTDAKAGAGSCRSAVNPEIKSSDFGGRQSDRDHHHGLSSGSAVDALHHIQGHSTRPASTAPSILHQKRSQDVVISTTTIYEPQNFSGNLPNTQSIVDKASKPADVEYEKPAVKPTPTADGKLGQKASFSKMKEPSSKFGGLQLVEILAKLPPVDHKSSMSLSQNSISLEPNEVADTPEASLLPKVSSDKDQQTSKSSPVSRAMSVLSSISGFRTSRQLSVTNENRIGVKNVEKDPEALHSVQSFNNDESRRHRHSNASRPDLSLRPSNLTTRPSQRKGTVTVPRASQEMDRESIENASLLQGHQKTGESFQKVIVDLELLLKEALSIAGQASREDSGTEPPPSRIRQKGYKRLWTAGSDDLSSAASDEEGQKGHIVVIEPDDEDMYQGHFTKARDATPFPRSLIATRHQSTAPLLDIRDSKLEQSSPSIEVTPIAGPTPLHYFEPFDSTKWALIKQPTLQPAEAHAFPAPLKAPNKEQQSFLVRDHGLTSETSGNTVVSHKVPQIQPRVSSKRAQGRLVQKDPSGGLAAIISSEDSVSTSGPYVADFKNSALQYHPVYREAMANEPPIRALNGSKLKEDETVAPLQPINLQDLAPGHSHPTKDEIKSGYTLKGRHHFEIREPHGFSLSRSHRRAPIARDWGSSRKRVVATMTCLNTGLMGLIVGIYAGEVPAIQYVVADDHHVVILGNVVFFIGLAITTALFWPLPLLHGRKPYTLAALTILLPLLFPQAIAVDGFRNPYVATYRVGLLVPRAIAGLVMGFANINHYATLLDLFGASLQSGNPHQEVVDEYDVRRHGGGMGVWLGIWTWCWVGSIGIGFWIGASIISSLQVSWGFWILIILTSTVLLLNVLTPEVRRSAYRRSMSEVRDGTDVSRRIARGEIKMHIYSTGPLWWWEEVWAGHVLCFRMIKQPGFAVLAFYLGWIYGQVVVIIVLLGALLSRYYFFHPQFVGLSIAIIPLGAVLAIPFQKASLFSRSRHHRQRTDSMTFDKRVTWTSHLVRRSIFMIILPFAGMAYTLASYGPPTHFMVPIIFAGLIGFLSNLAIAECNGIIMETFDTSDLQPGMTGRPRKVLPEEVKRKRTNFSCFPRVTAGFAISEAISFSMAAAVTGWGGIIERHLGAQIATAVMAGVLLILTLLLIAVLTRSITVQVIPSQRFGTNILSGPEDEWKPVIIGHPSGTTRRVNLLELGTLSRWTEIRRRNRLGTGF